MERDKSGSNRQKDNAEAEEPQRLAISSLTIVSMYYHVIANARRALTR